MYVHRFNRFLLSIPILRRNLESNNTKLRFIIFVKVDFEPFMGRFSRNIFSYEILKNNEG